MKRINKAHKALQEKTHDEGVSDVVVGGGSEDDVGAGGDDEGEDGGMDVVGSGVDDIGDVFVAGEVGVSSEEVAEIEVESSKVVGSGGASVSDVGGEEDNAEVIGSDEGEDEDAMRSERAIKQGQGRGTTCQYQYCSLQRRDNDNAHGDDEHSDDDDDDNDDDGGRREERTSKGIGTVL